LQNDEIVLQQSVTVNKRHGLPEHRRSPQMNGSGWG